MLRLLPAPIHGAIGLGALALNTLFWSVPLFLVAIVKLLLPIPRADAKSGSKEEAVDGSRH